MRICLQAELGRVKEHLLGRQGEIEDLESQLSESRAETQDIEDKYADLASEIQELQQKLASEVKLLLLCWIFKFHISEAKEALKEDLKVNSRKASKLKGILWIDKGLFKSP